MELAVSDEVETPRPTRHEAYLAIWRQDGCHQNPYDDATRMVHLLSRPTNTLDGVTGAFDELLQQLGQSHNAALRWEMTHVIHRVSVRRSIVLPTTLMDDYLRIASADRYDHVFAGFERALCDQLKRGNWRALTAMICVRLDALRVRYENFGGKKRLTVTQERLDALNKELYPKLKKVEARVRKEIAKLEQRKEKVAQLLEGTTLNEGVRENFTAELRELDDDIKDREKEVAEGFPYYFSSLRKTITELAGVVKRLSTLELQIRRHESLLAKHASA